MRAVLLVFAGCVTTAPALDVAGASHAAVDAYYHADVARIELMLGSDFVEVGGAAPTSRAEVLAKLRAHKPGDPEIVQRRWSDEHALVTPDQAVFVGRAAETENGRGASSDGRYTLMWRVEHGAWRLESMQWSRISAAAEHFDDVFRSGTGFEKAPNALLVKTLASLRPGTALDLMCGQGRNVLYEASLGWKATGIDYSAVGIDQARRAAGEHKLDVELVDADLDKTAIAGTYDLVTMLYAGYDPKLIAKAQAALAPGGTFVYEYFAQRQRDDGAPAGALAKLFAGYDIVVDEQLDDVPDWVYTRATLQRFVARKPAAAN